MVTIGTWNVENLFRPESQAGPDSNELYTSKLSMLADAIATIDPDVLALQEIGDLEALDDLVARLGQGWHTQAAEPDRRGIRVGLLSRSPLSDVEQLVDFPEHLQPVQVNDDGDTVGRMGRPALRAGVEVHGRRLTLVCCHLKSKLLTFPGNRFAPRDEDERTRYAVYALNRRAAESAAVRNYATELLDGQGREHALLVLGDLNDGPEAATTTLLQGPAGSEIGTAGFGRPDQGDGARLWNVAALIPTEKRHSRTYNGRPELIDHILVSHAMVHGIREVTTVDTNPDSVTDNPNERRNEPASDHRPVVARF